MIGVKNIDFSWEVSTFQENNWYFTRCFWWFAFSDWHFTRCIWHSRRETIVFCDRSFQIYCVFSAGEPRGDWGNLAASNRSLFISKSEPIQAKACLGKSKITRKQIYVMHKNNKITRNEIKYPHYIPHIPLTLIGICRALYIPIGRS